LEASVAKALDAVKPDNCKLVPVAAPKTGVINVGEVCLTTAPVPDAVVAPVPPLVTAKAVLNVRLVAEATPSMGVTNVGDVDNTFEPEPVLVVTPVPPLVTGKTLLTPVVRSTKAGGKNVACAVVPLLVSIVPVAPGVINDVELAAV
jgi:hypothetical protein